MNRIIYNCGIFNGINIKLLDNIFDDIETKTKTYKKNEIIFSTASKINNFGIIISGKVHVVKYDYWGNKLILATFSQLDIFGEIYALLKNIKLEVDVISASDCIIELINPNQLISSSIKHNCNTIIDNIISSICKKNIYLTRRMEIVTQRSVREKILSYLSTQATINNSSTFTIPLSRQELADFLAVDRAGMCVILSKLEKDGIISYKKNTFTILNNQN